MKIELDTNNIWDKNLIEKIFDELKPGLESKVEPKPKTEPKITKPLKTLTPKDLEEVVEAGTPKTKPPVILTAEGQEAIEKEVTRVVKEKTECARGTDKYYSGLHKLDYKDLITEVGVLSDPDITEIRLLCNKTALALGDEGVQTVTEMIQSTGFKNLTELPETHYRALVSTIKTYMSIKDQP